MLRWIGIVTAVASVGLALWPRFSLLGPIGGTELSFSGECRDTRLRLIEEPCRAVRLRVDGPVECVRVLDGGGRELARTLASGQVLSWTSGDDGVIEIDCNKLRGSSERMRVRVVAEPRALIELCEWAPLGALVGIALAGFSRPRPRGSPAAPRG